METSNTTDGQNTESNASGENQQTQTETVETVKNPEGVLTKNRELLGINKKLGEELKQLRTLVNSQEEDKKIAEGKKDEVITSLREKVRNLTSELEDTKDTYNWSTVEGQLKQAALKEGCVDAEKLVRLIDNQDIAGLEVDSKYRVNGDDLSSLLSKVKKDNPFMFGEGSANIDDLTPSNNIEKKAAKRVDDMTQEEIEAALLALDKQERS